MPARTNEPPTSDMPITRLVPGPDTDTTNGKRDRRARRESSAEPLDFDARRAARRARRESSTTEPLAAEAVAPDVADSDGATTAVEAHHTDREPRRDASGQRRGRPRAPRAEKIAADSASAIAGAEQPVEVAELAEGSTATAAALAIDVPGKDSSHGARTLQRAQRKQQAAAVAVGRADDHPAMGALNRHLNMLMQQLETAHRVLGRVAAERDALRQQLADLQGIPVEEIVVTSIGASKEKEDRPEKTREPAEPQPPSAIARFNYFRHEDIQVMRRRRQVAALCVLSLVLVLWLLSRMGIWQMPDNVSKDSLSGLPLIGELMSYFLAGWVFFRIVRVGGRGVKWVFPTDQKRRR